MPETMPYMYWLCAIDPGTQKSALVLYPVVLAREKKQARVYGKIYDNAELLEVLRKTRNHDVHDVHDVHYVIEMTACYGMPVGHDVLETTVWIGRFLEAIESRYGLVDRMTRVEVKQLLCHRTAGVTDAVLRQRIIDMYGGRESAIGNKQAPGPLYDIKRDMWQALALAITWREKYTMGGKYEPALEARWRESTAAHRLPSTRKGNGK